ncbi:Polyketide cyclase / dehydrase and lipid transport [Niabella drilacis]|uniref:Polyketide cyclase / dehydrase and lipid transport n=2 Tax=Niabella drilacis (strain DSM 25811 / CCM 8410 / CCUG 62505 / LMG 26954 / E90) TaxID=1285928 RepID=A0A1G6Y2D3_NIADE|nr:Polyketide cyclase / dehydrase and lipid transport [Niabella drilacis]
MHLWQPDFRLSIYFCVQKARMKVIRGILLFLVFLAVSLFVFSLLAPDKQEVVKSIVIKAPVKKVYDQMILLQNFNNWSVWGQSDSSIRYTTNRLPDGQVGTTIMWEGNALLSGKGKIALTGLQPQKQITHHISLMEPQKLEADSRFDLQARDSGTTVTWTFTIPSKKPWNVFNLFYSLEKEKGADFEKGLQALKLIIEKSPVKDRNAPGIVTAHFPQTQYVAIKQRVLWADLPGFFNTHFHHLEHYTLKDSAATPLRIGLFYKKDQKELQSDVAAAIEIPAGFRPQLQTPEELIRIPASKTIEAGIKDDPALKDLAYKTLDDYIAEKQLKVKTPTIEQYNIKDSTLRIIYLVE